MVDCAWVRCLLLLTSGWVIVACAGPNTALYKPTLEDVTAQAPDSFLVDIETSEGTITVKMKRIGHHSLWTGFGIWLTMIFMRALAFTE